MTVVYVLSKKACRIGQDLPIVLGAADVGGHPCGGLRTSKCSGGQNMKSYRIVTRGVDGSIRIREYDKKESLMRLHSQVGVDDSSTDLSLRGLPLFRGLIGPIPEGKHVVRYESPEIFETLTKEWANSKPARRTRRRRPLETPSSDEGLPSVG